MTAVHIRFKISETHYIVILVLYMSLGFCHRIQLRPRAPRPIVKLFLFEFIISNQIYSVLYYWCCLLSKEIFNKNTYFFNVIYASKTKFLHSITKSL